MTLRFLRTLACVTSCIFSYELSAQQVTVDNSFNSTDGGSQIGIGADEKIYAIKPLSDGKLLVGGQFSSYNGAAKSGILRLNSDGTADAFSGSASGGIVRTIAVDANGKILIGGTFTFVGSSAGNRIGRLNVDGTRDASFQMGTGPDNTVNAIAIDANGKILVGGQFQNYNGSAAKYLMRLNADGTIDGTFNLGGAGSNTPISSIAIDGSGKILIAGLSSYNGVGVRGIARLNSDGTLDNTFNLGTVPQGPNGAINSIVVNSSNEVIFGGSFTSFGATSVGKIARLTNAGALDATFNAAGSGANADISSLSIDANNKTLVGGQFTSFNNSSRSYIARLNSDGTIDNAFVSPGSGLNNVVYSVAVDISGRVITGGAFTMCDGIYASRLIGFQSNGNIDTAFNPLLFKGASAIINKAVYAASGKVLVIGSFTGFAGKFKNHLAQLNADGTLDESFNSGGTGANNDIYAIDIDANGKILIGGAFTTYNGGAANGIARLNADGTLDNTFNNGGSGVGGNVFDLVVNSNGTIIIAGSFNSFNGTAVKNIARLNTNGTHDATFATPGSGPNSAINKLAIDADGKIVIAGTFSSINGTSFNKLARLNSDGSVDPFNTGGAGMNPTGSVSTIAFNASGKILIGGNFVSYNGTSFSYLARLNADGTLDNSFSNTAGSLTVQKILIDQDGKILAGRSGSGANTLTRHNADGTIDPFFNVNTAANASIQSMVLIDANHLLIAGNFTSFNNTGKGRIAKLKILSSQTINGFTDLSATYGDNNFNITATATSSLTVSYTSSNTNVATVSGNVVTIKNAGVSTITASQSGDANFFATSLQKNLTVAKAPVTATADNKSRVYGDLSSPLTITYSGLKGSDTGSVIDSAPSISSAGFTTSANAGSYPITLTGGSDANYSLSLVNGTYTVSKANLTATANNLMREFGKPNPTLTITYTGLKAGDNASVIDTPPTISTTATLNSPIGPYPITLANGADNNYTFQTLINGVLTVGKVTLTATALNQSRVYGENNQEFVIEYSGFIGTDNSSSIDTAPTASSAATATSKPNSYPIILQGGQDDIYQFALVNGVVTVNKAPLTAIAHNATRVYGEVNPDITIDYTGFVNGETQVNSGITPPVVSIPDQNSPAGVYMLLLTGGSGGENYDLLFATPSGQLIIDKAAQAITFVGPEKQTTGTKSVLLNATASSGLPVNYRIKSGPATVAGNILTFTGQAGTIVITAMQSGDANYKPAAEIDWTFEVVNETITGVEDAEILSVWPNPVTDRLYLKGAPEGSIAKILTSTGSEYVPPISISKDEQVVNVKDLNAGMYFLLLAHPGGIELVRFIKQ